MRFEVNNVIRAPISKSFIKTVIQAFARVFRMPKDTTVSIAFIGDNEIRKLNKAYRGQNKVTDVLSFSDREYPDNFSGRSLGEIILSYPQAKRQAKRAGHGVKQEIQILLIHGLAHLLGYDHKTKKQVEEMDGAEKRVMGWLENPKKSQ